MGLGLHGSVQNSYFAKVLHQILKWIIQEWKHRLRSSIHPTLFAGIYGLISLLSNTLQLSPHVYSELMIAGPKILQAVLAALVDYSTWTLSCKVYGRNSKESWATVGPPIIYIKCTPLTNFVPESRLIRCHSWRFVAYPNGHQPVELVLLDTNAIKLLGDYPDDCGTQSMALAVVDRDQR